MSGYCWLEIKEPADLQRMFTEKSITVHVWTVNLNFSITYFFLNLKFMANDFKVKISSFWQKKVVFFLNVMSFRRNND